MNLRPPDERTIRALRNLRANNDFDDVLAWLQYSLSELDSRTRTTLPEPLLRQQQGAAQVIAELVDHAQGKQVKAIERVRPTPGPGLDAT